jgi:hypothetical protein
MASCGFRLRDGGDPLTLHHDIDGTLVPGAARVPDDRLRRPAGAMAPRRAPTPGAACTRRRRAVRRVRLRPACVDGVLPGVWNPECELLKGEHRRLIPTDAGSEVLRRPGYVARKTHTSAHRNPGLREYAQTPASGGKLTAHHFVGLSRSSAAPVIVNTPVLIVGTRSGR